MTLHGMVSALTLPLGSHQQRLDYRPFGSWAYCIRGTFRTLHWRVTLTAKDSQHLPTPRPDTEELRLTTFVFRDRNFCPNRGSWIAADPTKPACAHFGKKPQALTLFIPWPLQNVLKRKKAVWLPHPAVLLAEVSVELHKARRPVRRSHVGNLSCREDKYGLWALETAMASTQKTATLNLEDP